MEAMLNAIRLHAGAMDMGQGQPRIGTIANVDPNTYSARVHLQPEGVLSGWLPMMSSWIGGGWGIVCPPTTGDQVVVIAQEGDAEHGIIAGRIYSDQQRPPAGVVGEIWLMHKSGSFIKLQNDGTVQIKGDLHVTGSIFSTVDMKASGEVVAKDGGSAVHLSTHRHTNTQAGTGQSGPPQAGS